MIFLLLLFNINLNFQLLSFSRLALFLDKFHLDSATPVIHIPNIFIIILRILSADENFLRSDKSIDFLWTEFDHVIMRQKEKS